MVTLNPYPYRSAPKHVRFHSILAGDCAERLHLLACAHAMTSPATAAAYAEAALREARKSGRKGLINAITALQEALWASI